MSEGLRQSEEEVGTVTPSHDSLHDRKKQAKNRVLQKHQNLIFEQILS